MRFSSLFVFTKLDVHVLHSLSDTHSHSLTMRFTSASLFALGAAVLAVAQPSRRTLSLNPDASLIRPIPHVPAAQVEPITNAKRFAMNLPPARPKAHRRRPHGVAPRAGQ